MRVTQKEALKKLLQVKWKTAKCGQKDCWCRLIIPVKPIKYTYKGKEYEYDNVIHYGVLNLQAAKHIVKIHNASL